MGFASGPQGNASPTETPCYALDFKWVQVHYPDQECIIWEGIATTYLVVNWTFFLPDLFNPLLSPSDFLELVLFPLSDQDFSVVGKHFGQVGFAYFVCV